MMYYSTSGAVCTVSRKLFRIFPRENLSDCHFFAIKTPSGGSPGGEEGERGIPAGRRVTAPPDRLTACLLDRLTACKSDAGRRSRFPSEGTALGSGDDSQTNGQPFLFFSTEREKQQDVNRFLFVIRLFVGLFSGALTRRPRACPIHCSPCANCWRFARWFALDCQSMGESPRAFSDLFLSFTKETAALPPQAQPRRQKKRARIRGR